MIVPEARIVRCHTSIDDHERGYALVEDRNMRAATFDCSESTIMCMDVRMTLYVGSACSALHRADLASFLWTYTGATVH